LVAGIVGSPCQTGEFLHVGISPVCTTWEEKASNSSYFDYVVSWFAVKMATLEV
jgi:hypothetical protein